MLEKNCLVYKSKISDRYGYDMWITFDQRVAELTYASACSQAARRELNSSITTQAKSSA